MDIEFSHRLSKLPLYLFVEIDKAKRKAREEIPGLFYLLVAVKTPSQSCPGGFAS